MSAEDSDALSYDQVLARLREVPGHVQVDLEEFQDAGDDDERIMYVRGWYTVKNPGYEEDE